ncbi:asparagine synthase (glutamine-hydrolyzing) [Polynucleobacter bastaniensis]|uniref:asparagine synthase (glutamine-hydrolyzing) n=1 Tax=Polynucleobacter bastaniensis TaxID=2081039 RepID=UPI001C0D01B4|nr:asparagine synthase (glutamine-hydrolyzing) [Polynucleobacter bastaniensis]MBU3598280.1 asparagine synthase (glutamine-hydrolyzing) [Polynucleobacter bastaniensis]
MCGVAGFISPNPISLLTSRNILIRMIKSISHRGPDGEGVWVSADAKVSLGHRRLSILDLTSAGHQPMFSAFGRFVITFNGEIYNASELKQILLENRRNPCIDWRGHSDTEVFVNLIEAFGVEKAVTMSSGMFSFAVFDLQEETLILGRDRVGEKPLYYGWQGDAFIFASELKAIKQHPKFCGVINRTALYQFIQLGYVPAPLSIYSQIFKLEPGYLLEINLKGEVISKKPYWELDIQKKYLQGDIISSSDNLERILLNVIDLQMKADVPVGAFLSGGIDSSLICTLMQKNSKTPIQTFTVAFNEEQYDESRHATAVADAIGCENNRIYLTGQIASKIVPDIALKFDEPFADSSQIPTFLLADYVKRNIKVVLTGDGGDELFGGYNRHISAHYHLPKITAIPYFFRGIVHRVMASMSVPNVDKALQIAKILFKKFEEPGEFVDKYYKVVDAIGAKTSKELYLKLVSQSSDISSLMSYSDVGWDTSYFDAHPRLSVAMKMMLEDFHGYLPDDILVKSDRMTMSVGLEARMPFLDRRVIELAFALPDDLKFNNGSGKYILRKILSKYLDEDMFNRAKKGFSMPLAEWLRGPLKEWAESLLSARELKKHSLFNAEFIQKKWSEHLSGKRNAEKILWPILMFQSWYIAEEI